MRNGFAIAVLALMLATVPLAGWGRRGHGLATRVAVSALPADVPAFFRQARERLAYLASEPDRWRGARTPALTAATSSNHHFETELWGNDPLPANRDLLLAASRRTGMSGTGPAGAVELAERLSADLRYWREGTANTQAERMVLRQLEENVLYTAGVLAHYVTDLSNPMHASVHAGGWAAGYPNPNGYIEKPGKGMHGRFESLYVQEFMTEKEVAARMTSVRRMGSWIKELEAHTRRSNSFVAQIYEFEKKGAWGSGHEPPDARAFTAARLAEGAAMLRDIYYTAWVLSRDAWFDEPVAYIGRKGRTLLEQMRELHEIEPRHHLTLRRDNGVLGIVGIDNRKNGMEGREWRGYINGKPVTAGIDRQATEAYDRIEYRFEKLPLAAR